MDYEKEYKAMVQRAKELHKDGNALTKQQMEIVCPELVESEDERIREWLYEYIDAHNWRNDYTVSKEEALAYLERQKDEAQKQFNLGVQAGREEAMYELGLGKWPNCKNEEDNDFTIYHPLKNGKGEYECVPYSFYGSLTSFSEDKDLIDFLRNCFYTEEECNEWIETRKGQKPIEPIEFNNEFENQVSYLLASILNGEHKYNEGFVKYAAQSLLGYAKKEQNLNKYPLCETIKDKIKCYIANHFIADKVVTTDIPSIVHAMEEGVRLGKEEQKTNPLVQIAENNKAIVEDIRNGVPTKTIEETRGVKFAAPIGKEQKLVDWNDELEKCKKYPLYFYDKYVKIKLKPIEWSEEDENNLKRAINICVNDFGEDCETAKFLKSLHERFNLQPKQAWSEEDKEIYNSFKVFCQRLIENKKETFEADPCYAQKMLSWLKSLCPQSKQEWSVEDEEKLNWCINLVISQDSLSSEWKKEVLDWLNFLRSQPQHRDTYYDIIHNILATLKDMDFTKITPEHRISLLNDIRVKCKNADECAAILDEPHWKPSKEQLDALKEASASWMNKEMGNCELLESLYNDLKKL